jgi:hypothetical protein
MITAAQVGRVAGAILCLMRLGSNAFGVEALLASETRLAFVQAKHF